MFSKVDLIILGLLSERPMHGYEINQILTSSEMALWVEVGRTTIYYSLSRLAKNGFITEIIEKQPDKPEKSVFHITQQGREKFIEALTKTLGEQKKTYLDYNIGLFFVDKLPRAGLIEALRRRQKFLNSWLSAINKNIRRQKARLVYPSALQGVMGHTGSFIENEIKWLDAFIGQIEGTGAEEVPAAERARQATGVLHGKIEYSAIPDLIHLVAVGKRTGALTLRQANLVFTLSFVEGKLNYLTSSLRQASSKESATIQLVLDDILSAFQWDQGNFIFQPDEIVNDGGAEVKLSNEQFILEGCRRVDDWTRIRRLVPSEQMVFDIIKGCEKIITSLPLNDKEKTVLSNINGIRNVQTIAHLSNLSIFETSKTLYSFMTVGFLTTVSIDKAQTVDLLKDITDSILERVYLVAGKGEAAKIEKEINSFAEGERVPFSLAEGTMSEKVEFTLELSQLVEMEKRFFQIQIETIAKQLGKSFIVSLLKSVINHLAPDKRELFLRYGFDQIKRQIV